MSRQLIQETRTVGQSRKVSSAQPPHGYLHKYSGAAVFDGGTESNITRGISVWINMNRHLELFTIIA